MSMRFSVHLVFIFGLGCALCGLEVKAQADVPNTKENFEKIYQIKPVAPQGLQCKIVRVKENVESCEGTDKNNKTMRQITAQVKPTFKNGESLYKSFKSVIQDVDKICRFTCMQLAQNAVELSRSLKNKNCGLTDFEIFSILMYTDVAYSTINSTLRSGTSSEIDELRPFLNIMNSGLNKLSDYKGWVRRGTYSMPFEKMNQNGELVFTEKGYMSTSVNIPFAGQVKMLIQSKKCKYIGPLSLKPYEEEVLCKPGTEFWVRKNIGNELFVIEEK